MMKRLLFLLLGIGFLSSCQEDCTYSLTYQTYNPVYVSLDSLRSSVRVQEGQNLEIPGKIYYSPPFLFINEFNKGIHIFNNTQPESPQNVAFINIPGNVDMAVLGNYLYADSYSDLVVLDISNPTDAREVFRLEGVYNNSFPEFEQNILVDWQLDFVTTETQSSCDEGVGPNNGGIPLPFAQGDLAASIPSAAPTNSGGVAGIGGSLARFTISQNHLYIVDWNNLYVFDLLDPKEPSQETTVYLNWGVETIFPYQDHLFIGTQAGMHILDNEDPSQPVHISSIEHARSCDPVVVQDNYAYVTLRSGTACEGFSNQLEVIDISDLYNPERIAIHPMLNPHGLGIDQETLFICEGEHGLKVFDAEDPFAIGDNLRMHFTDMHSYDVIPFQDVLLMIGNDGLYQFDYNDPLNLKLLSQIPVTPPSPEN